jgi:hypothetical protein
MYKDISKMLLKLVAWFVVAFLAFTFFILQCSQKAEASIEITDVIYAIEEVESNRNPHAINTQENALGCLQIRPIMIADYNRITGEDLAHDVAYNRSMAYIIASTIFNHYMKGIEKPNAKHLAFIWNGGGGAWRRVDYPQKDTKQKMLDIYWEKVKLHL